MVQRIRTFTGLSTLDLPTEAQWEYACRAGTATALNSGKDTTQATSFCNNFAEVGWQKYSCTNEVADGITCPVGLLAPNAWGLYDMHGNVFEKCLDRYSDGEDYHATFETGWEDGAVTIDPKGPTTGDIGVVRGGNFWYFPAYGRSAARIVTRARSVGSRHDGFRFVCNLPVEE